MFSSILNWFDPLSYRSYWRFYKEYCNYEQHPKYGYHIFLGSKNEKELRAKLKPVMLRRTKEQVLDLEEKFYTYRTLEMAPQQARAYKEMKIDSLAWIGQYEDEAIPAPTVLAQLTRLRQFADAYCEWGKDGKVQMMMPSPKVSELLNIVEDTDGSVVVWSQFKGMINLAWEQLVQAGVSAVRYTGDQSEAKRDEAIEGFQSGKYQVFLGVMQAGGEGVDGLQEASSTCVFLDRAWTPKDNEQAEDRLHRDGQKAAVQVIILQAEKTVDMRVEKKLEFKRAMIRKIIDGQDEEVEAA